MIKRTIPRATHTGELHIGPNTIDCAVLQDGTRVLTQGAFFRAIGRSERPTAGKGSRVEKVAPFLDLYNLKPYVSNELADSTKPIVFQTPRGGRAYGYKAELLPKVCEVYLQARDDGNLLKTQARFAKACDILMRGLAHIGIIALVDEATGYQEIRDRAALQAILDKFLQAERAKWAKRFPDDFYRQMFRLRDWQWKGMKVNRPSVVGKYTNDFVYDRLAPGILDELKRLNPKNEKGHRAAKHHQHFTPDIGHPALQAHLSGVVALMRASINWDQFKRMLQRAYPKVNTNLVIPFPDPEEPS